jgi:hypothetical protein
VGESVAKLDGAGDVLDALLDRAEAAVRVRKLETAAPGSGRGAPPSAAERRSGPGDPGHVVPGTCRPHIRPRPAPRPVTQAGYNGGTAMRKLSVSTLVSLDGIAALTN